MATVSKRDRPKQSTECLQESVDLELCFQALSHMLSVLQVIGLTVMETLKTQMHLPRAPSSQASLLPFPATLSPSTLHDVFSVYTNTFIYLLLKDI